MGPRSALEPRASTQPPPKGHLSRLRDLVDEAALVNLGWDPATRVLTPDPAHALLGFLECEVTACPYPAIGSTRLCCGCRQVWSAHAKPDLALFKAKGVQRRSRMPGLLRLELYRVCCIPGHERPARIGGLAIAARAGPGCEASRSTSTSPVTAGAVNHRRWCGCRRYCCGGDQAGFRVDLRDRAADQARPHACPSPDRGAEHDCLRLPGSRQPRRPCDGIQRGRRP